MLDALAAQTFTDFEVVVVDDGSTDGAPEEAERDAKDGRSVRLIANPGSGAVAARRAGVAEAAGRYLAFTDSDCVPEPGWLAAGVEALESGADVVQGVTRPARAPRAFERTVSVPGEDGLYATCNVFYRRDAYDAAGGFDETAGCRFRYRAGARLRGLGFGEDVLLGWRVRREGRAAFAPDAVVLHHVFERDFRESLRRTWTVGAFPALVHEVPELRRSLLVGGVGLGGRSRLPLYAAAGLLAAGRPRIAAAATGAWVGMRWRRLGRMEPSRRARLRVLPVDLALDAFAAVALVSGSIRARTVVL
jgi:hypothetical protein